MKKLIFSILAVILLLNAVWAETDSSDGQSIRLPKTPPLVEQMVPQDENATLSLTGFTRSLLRLYEGTRVDFNIYNQYTRNLEVVNSLIVTNVEDGYADILLSSDGSEYEKARMKLGDMVQLNYTNGAIPFMFLELRKLRYVEDEDGSIIKHITIFFNVPLITKSMLKGTGDAVKVVDAEKVIPINNNKGNSNMKFYLLGVLALAAAIFLFRKNSKEEQHSESIPDQALK